jgi:superfamily II DNA or RNA helicase
MSSSSKNELPSKYWQAEAMSSQVWERFSKAVAAKNSDQIRNSFFLLTRYYGRTITILRSAIEDKRNDLARVAIENLIVLDRVLGGMHRAVPGELPLALPFTEEFHAQFVQSLILRSMKDVGAIDRAELLKRLDRLHLLGETSDSDVDEAVAALLSVGALSRQGEKFRRHSSSGSTVDTGEAMLKSLVGADLTRKLAEKGFAGLDNIAPRRRSFVRVFVGLTGLGEDVAGLFANLAAAFEDERRATTPQLAHRDLIRSGIPRIYQHESFEALRTGGYQGLVIESLAGSGKTLIGLMCIQDWLEQSGASETVLVLAPSSNYQQQWLRECCYSPLGLQLPPENVFAGTPAELARRAKYGADKPAVIITTYSSMRRLLNGNDGHIGELDAFFEQNKIKSVILDEIHGVVDDPDSTGSALVAALREMLDRGALSHLVGFSGTASAYRARFDQLGLRIAHIVPAIKLVASGFVAPYAEFGVAFGYSKRELQIRDALERYKQVLHAFLEIITEPVIKAYIKIPIDRRTEIATRILGMGSHDNAAREHVAQRLTGWESLQELSLADADLVTIAQIAERRADRDLVPEAQVSAFANLVDSAKALRHEIATLAPTQDLLATGDIADLGQLLSVDAIEQRLAKKKQLSAADRRDLLSTTLLGHYDVLTGLYRRMGEGRVSAMRAIIEAEREGREFRGAIIFDDSRRLDWHRLQSQPGFAGTAGAFAEMLGRDGIVPVAALSTELYLPHDNDDPLSSRVAAYIRGSIMEKEIGGAIANLLLAGLGLNEKLQVKFRETLTTHLQSYLDAEAERDRPSIDRFSAAVLRPMRQQFGHRQRYISVGDAAVMRQRLNPKNLNLRTFVQSLADYAALVRDWRAPHKAEVQRADGTILPYAVVEMPSGRKRQLMYDLVSRLIDDAGLPVNMLIVTEWARTGWNVIAPNVLIDATATRDVTAWQQLRGRAMRASRSWTPACHSLETSLMSAYHSRSNESAIAQIPAATSDTARVDADPLVKKVITASLSKWLKDKLEAEKLGDLSSDELLDAATQVMIRNNKVTHIYEMVKASGSEVQIRFDRQDGRWLRKEAIAEKHDDQLGVVLETGSIATGEAHAPLIYRDDPRSDEPDDIRAALLDRAVRRDEEIVKAWLLAGV